MGEVRNPKVVPEHQAIYRCSTRCLSTTQALAYRPLL